ncbi:MAG: diacylglycerol kinase family protein [Verrucomicrobiales bacterium]|nr:diacylglycerol kinase family protein [Verrucomicrobiales bacterium]
MSESSGQTNLVRCFVDALRGIESVFKSERNFRIHLAVAVAVIVLGFVLKISSFEWLAIILCMGFVLVAEVLNTSIEYLADVAHPEMDPGVRRAKDAAAGGVLIASVAAASVGVIVYLPKLWEWLSKS